MPVLQVRHTGVKFTAISFNCRLGPLPQTLAWIVLGSKFADGGKHGVLYTSTHIPRDHETEVANIPKNGNSK